MGCHMEVSVSDKKVTGVIGNTCKRGANYAVDEVTNPKRTLTTTVKTDKGIMLSVKTADAISREKITEAMTVLSDITVKTPVKIGEIICENICDSGINVIATKNLA